MPRQYPYISDYRKEQRGKCVVCGAPAEYLVIIQVNWFRGDDESARTCHEHKRQIYASEVLGAEMRRKEKARADSQKGVACGPRKEGV